MQDFFDKQQSKLISYLDDPSQNNVGHFTKQIFLASGGLAGSVADQSLSSGEGADFNFIKSVVNAADKTINPGTGGKYANSAMGEGFYNSPPYIAARFTDLGKFFSGAEPGNYYTNRYDQPQKSPALKSEHPSDFYSRWYERMRNFAQAEEVANRGQSQVRTR